MHTSKTAKSTPRKILSATPLSPLRSSRLLLQLISLLSLLLALQLSTGCKWRRKLRTLFHPEENISEVQPPPTTANPAPNEPPALETPRSAESALLRGAHFGLAKLELQVKPPKGLNILIDGAKVAESSPYILDGLQVGPHTLEIRAMGYYPLKLPLVITAANQVLQIPLALRERPLNKQAASPTALSNIGLPPLSSGQSPADAQQFATTPALSLSSNNQPLTSPTPTTSATITPPSTTGIPNPLVLRPIYLKFALEPAQEILLNQRPLTSDKVLIEEPTGRLQAGDLWLDYQVKNDLSLTLTIPPAKLLDAVWKVDGVVYKSPNPFTLHKGVNSIERRNLKGETQILVIIPLVN